MLHHDLLLLAAQTAVAIGSLPKGFQELDERRCIQDDNET